MCSIKNILFITLSKLLDQYAKKQKTKNQKTKDEEPKVRINPTKRWKM